jgi:hypothetical protein
VPLLGFHPQLARLSPKLLVNGICFLPTTDKVTQPLSEETALTVEEVYPASDDGGKGFSQCGKWQST